MNKKLIADLASIATELDVKGFTKEAKTMDNVLIRVAQMSNEGMSDQDMDEIDIKFKAGKEKAKQILKDMMYGGDLYDSLDQLEDQFLGEQEKLKNIISTADDYLYDDLENFYGKVQKFLEEMGYFRSFLEEKFRWYS